MKSTGKYVLSFFALSIFFQSGILAQLSPESLSPAETIKKFQTSPTAENLVAVRQAGFALLGENKFDDSEVIFSEILAKFPADGLSLYGKAIGLFNRKQYSEAESRRQRLTRFLKNKKTMPRLQTSWFCQQLFQPLPERTQRR